MNTTLLGSVNRDIYREGLATPRWEKYTGVDMGKDGNVLHHQIITARLIRNYGKHDMESGSITKEQYTQLRITGLLHDIPEYIGGDVTLDDKHSASKDSERIHWNSMIAKILKGNTEMIDKSANIYEIDANPDHPLFPIFKIHEKLGYLQGAILASKLNSGDDTITQWLINNVIGNNLSTLILSSREYASVQVFLIEHLVEISRLIDIGANHMDRSGEKNTTFKKAREDWEKYV